MTCPRCHAEFRSQRQSCPECGIKIVRSVFGMVKTSAVFIAAGEERCFYRSVQEVPEPLRTRLIETTNSANSGTIVIADRAGQQQITEAIQRRSSDAVEAEELCAATPEAKRLSWLAWMALAFVLTLGAVLSILFHVRW